VKRVIDLFPAASGSLQKLLRNRFYYRVGQLLGITNQKPRVISGLGKILGQARVRTSRTEAGNGYCYCTTGCTCSASAASERPAKKQKPAAASPHPMPAHYKKHKAWHAAKFKTLLHVEKGSRKGEWRLKAVDHQSKLDSNAVRQFTNHFLKREFAEFPTIKSPLSINIAANLKLKKGDARIRKADAREIPIFAEMLEAQGEKGLLPKGLNHVDGLGLVLVANRRLPVGTVLLVYAGEVIHHRDAPKDSESGADSVVDLFPGTVEALNVVISPDTGASGGIAHFASTTSAGKDADTGVWDYEHSNMIPVVLQIPQLDEETGVTMWCTNFYLIVCDTMENQTLAKWFYGFPYFEAMEGLMETGAIERFAWHTAKESDALLAKQLAATGKPKPLQPKKPTTTEPSKPGDLCNISHTVQVPKPKTTPCDGVYLQTLKKLLTEANLGISSRHQPEAMRSSTSTVTSSSITKSNLTTIAETPVEISFPFTTESSKVETLETATTVSTVNIIQTRVDATSGVATTETIQVTITHSIDAKTTTPK